MQSIVQLSLEHFLVNTNTCMHTYIHTYNTYIHAHNRIHTNTHIQTYIHAHIQYIHTYIHIQYMHPIHTITILKLFCGNRYP